MKLSRSQNLYPENINNVPAGKRTLNFKESAWINEFYWQNNSQYQSLVEEYEKEKSRNQRLKIVEAFPSKKNWVPSFQNLQPSDRKLLHGPPQDINVTLFWKTG